MLKQLCIVLRAVNYKDYDKILTLFSRTEGKIQAQARGVRKIKSGLSTAAQPFYCGEYEFYQKKDRLFVTNALLKEEFFKIQNNYDAYTAGCVMLELSEKILEHTDESERLFITLIHTLYAMEKHQLDASVALGYFFVQTIDLLGVFPALDFCVCCGEPIVNLSYWNAAEGGAVCTDCAPNIMKKKLKPGVNNFFSLMVGIKPKEIAALGQPDESIEYFLRIAEEYLLLAGDVKLKTMKFFAPQ